MFPEKFNVSIIPCAGGPYRHEVLETPMQTRKKAVTWTGEHRSLDVNQEILYVASHYHCG